MDHPIDVIEALSCLMGKDGLSNTFSGKSGSTQTRNSPSTMNRKPLRKIRATLHAQDVDFFHKNAASELREDPRLHLRQCVNDHAEPNLLFVRQWWETKARIGSKPKEGQI